MLDDKVGQGSEEDDKYKLSQGCIKHRTFRYEMLGGKAELHIGDDINCKYQCHLAEDDVHSPESAVSEGSGEVKDQGCKEGIYAHEDIFAHAKILRVSGYAMGIAYAPEIIVEGGQDSYFC